MKTHRFLIILPVVASLSVVAPVTLGQSSGAPAMAKQYVFPAKSQAPEQQQKDENDCSAWATKESGFDPAKPPAPPAKPTTAPPPAPPPGTTGKSAVKGAAAGYIIGDLANDEGGEGAAIGAVVGAASSRRKQKGAQQASQQQQQSVDQQYQQAMSKYQADVKAKQDEYLKARAACLEAKGYTVK